MIYTALDDFYLTAAELEASPSRHDGVDAALESQLRRYGCDAMAEAVVLLHLPQAVACTAQVLLHRFYCKLSLAKFDVKVVSIAAFWLGAKLEEVIEIDSPTKLRLRDIMMVFYRIFRRKDSKSIGILDPYSSQYDLLKTEVVRTERHMLRAFGFIVHVEHPHRFVLTFGQLLGLDKDLLQEAWNLANDSLRIPLCVRYKAEVVACGLLFLAARRRRVPMPENPPWWQVFGVSQQQLLEVTVALAELLQQPRAVYVATTGRDYTSRGVNGGASPDRVLLPSGGGGGPSAAVEKDEKHQGHGAGAAVPKQPVVLTDGDVGRRKQSASDKLEDKPLSDKRDQGQRNRSKSAHKERDDHRHKDRSRSRYELRDDRRTRSIGGGGHSSRSRSRSRSTSRDRYRRRDRDRYRNDRSDDEDRRYNYSRRERSRSRERSYRR